MKYVAYYRVSTSKQQKSGLGLAAQQATIKSFLQPGDELIAEFVEAVSGKRDDREQLQQAIKSARKHDAKLVIAKLDRFSRKVSFIAKMMESDVGLVVADMPNATEFQLHIFAALAQEERRLISARTKAALAQAKLQGIKLGANGKNLAYNNRERAARNADEVRSALPVGWETMAFSAIAKELNSRGVKTPQGSKFHPQTIKNLIFHLN
ncbi:recombinase family protein [Neorhizobium galegae]|uniref:recombinase family protein n=1 Tax=Neorhizobium galegae TaxID=399 RepID=UPI000622A0A4|nr:recombinase family protein [Neorhizobium galegae]KAB1120017.1 DNA invertase [Neorhizobium galegae]MCQ1810642.1 recombinase family protein [Neorhizobium galegae]CDZ64780.1 Resolvase-like serine recombinase [Neorhizobium galegae bv. orientalis]